MTHSDDILSVIFLALIAVVVAGIVNRMLPEGSLLLVPSFMVICVAVWIAYDYMMRQRFQQKEKCLMSVASLINERKKPVDSKLDEPEDPEEPDEPDEPAEPEEPAEPDEQPAQKPPTKRRVELYNPEPEDGTADTVFSNRMKYTGVQPQMAQIARAMHNKYALQPYFEEELREHAEREWWNSDHLDLDF